MELEVVSLKSSELDVELVPGAGARLHRVRAFGHDLLRTPDDLVLYRRERFFWGGYVMAPWCNRLGVEPLTVADRTFVPAVNFDDGTAIHGLVHSLPWRQVDEARFRVDVEPSPAWPWRFAVEMTVGVDGTDLTLDLALMNLDDGPMPAGMGLHPWFIKPLEIEIPARSVHHVNRGSRPEPVPVDNGGDRDHDRRALGPLALGVDATWTDLDRSTVEMRWSEAGVRSTLELGPSARFVVAANLPGIDAVALEPQTHGPDGMRRLLNGEPGALALLEPGSRLPLLVRYRFATDAT